MRTTAEIDLASCKYMKPRRTSTTLTLLDTSKIHTGCKKTKFQRSSTPRALLKLKKNVLTSTMIQKRSFKSILANISAIGSKKNAKRKVHNTKGSSNAYIPNFGTALNGSYIIGDIKLWIL